MINKSRLIRLTQKVISCNSENPPGNEWDLAQFIIKDMKSCGLEVKIYTYAKAPAEHRGDFKRDVAARKSES